MIRRQQDEKDCVTSCRSTVYVVVLRCVRHHLALATLET